MVFKMFEMFQVAYINTSIKMTQAAVWKSFELSGSKIQTNLSTSHIDRCLIIIKLRIIRQKGRN